MHKNNAFFFRQGKGIFCLLLAFLLFAAPVLAQEEDREIRELSFTEFLNIVLAGNLDYIIEQFEIPVAEAAVVAARVYEDPELEVMLPAFDRDDFSGMPRNIAFEVEVPIELFGKRKTRIKIAEKERELARTNLEDYLRFFRAEAAMLYAEILVNQLVIERMNLSLEQLEQLTEVNEILFEVGEIGEIDLLQTRLEAHKFKTEIFDLRVDYNEILTELFIYMGAWQTDSLIFIGDLDVPRPMDNFDVLLERTIEERTDVLLAMQEIELADLDIRLAQAERRPDIAIIAGYHNEAALRPGPGFGAVYTGFRMPLMFSGFNRGELQIAQYRREQVSLGLDLVKLEAESELRESWNRFDLIASKKQIFSEEILSNAERVRDAAVFSYQSGEISLLEVLEAQRTLNEIYVSYYETLGQYAEALIDLSRASGMWLIEF